MHKDAQIQIQLTKLYAFQENLILLVRKQMMILYVLENQQLLKVL